MYRGLSPLRRRVPQAGRLVRRFAPQGSRLERFADFQECRNHAHLSLHY
jgi:hypothetical protein